MILSLSNAKLSDTWYHFFNRKAWNLPAWILIYLVIKKTCSFCNKLITTCVIINCNPPPPSYHAVFLAVASCLENRFKTPTSTMFIVFAEKPKTLFDFSYPNNNTWKCHALMNKSKFKTFSEKFNLDLRIALMYWKDTG